MLKLLLKAVAIIVNVQSQVNHKIIMCNICMGLDIYVYTQTHIHTDTHIYIYIYVYMYSCIYTYTHTPYKDIYRETIQNPVSNPGITMCNTASVSQFRLHSFPIVLCEKMQGLQSSMLIRLSSSHLRATLDTRFTLTGHHCHTRGLFSISESNGDSIYCPQSLT